MADFGYNIFCGALMQGTINLLEAGDDVRVLLLEANSDVEADDDDIATVLGRAGTTELSSTNYTRQNIGTQVVAQDDANDRAEFNGDPITFSNLVQAGSETIVAYLVYKFVTNDAGSTPMQHQDISPAKTPNGDFTINWDAQGITQLASAAGTDFVYNIMCYGLMTGAIDLDTAGDDIRVLLFQANSDVNKDDGDVTTVLGRAGTTELTSTNYTRQAIANEAVSVDDTQDEGEFTGDPVTFSNLVQAAAEEIVGYLLFKFVTDDDGSTPLQQQAVSPAIVPGGDFTINPSATQGYTILYSA
jgi:hypothetical protein